MTDGQPRLLTNRLKLFMNAIKSICDTISSSTPRVPAHVYKVNGTKLLPLRKKQNHCSIVIWIT